MLKFVPALSDLNIAKIMVHPQATANALPLQRGFT